MYHDDRPMLIFNLKLFCINIYKILEYNCLSQTFLNILNLIFK